MNISIKGKNILVFGASSFIGFNLVDRCLKEGANVVGTFLNNPPIFDNQKYRQYKCDVTVDKDINNLYSNLKTINWMVDVLIDCVGILSDSSIEKMNMHDWRRVIDINLNGTFSIIKGALSVMNNTESKIICVSSIMGVYGREEQSNYSSSKAGLGMLAKIAAVELAEKNIAVNVVCPGFISTNLNNGNIKKRQVAINESYLSIEKNLECLVNFFIFMSSDFFRNITGQTFIIDSRIMRVL